MKRIVKLKGELLIIALISLVISFITAGIIKQQGGGVYSRDSTYRINLIYSKSITDLKKNLKSSNVNNYFELQQLLDRKYSFNSGYSFYIVDNAGSVVAGSNKGLLAIDKKQVKDGKKEYSISKSDINVFKISGCDYLKDGYFLYYVYLGYGNDDKDML